MGKILISIINIGLYCIYTLLFLGIITFALPIFFLVIGEPIPRFDMRQYEIIGYIGAGIILSITFLLRRTFYISFSGNKYNLGSKKESYTIKKREEKLQNNTKIDIEEKSSKGENEIKIYIDKEIR